MSDLDIGRAFLASAELPLDRSATNDPPGCLAERTRAHDFQVNELRLDALPGWHLGDDLVHDTRRFFTVGGVAVATNFGPIPQWKQPIILQPEIGMLGFLGQRIDGTLHLLAQAKMEPGNRVMVQFSPTVQATPSNYTRVHGGTATPYLEYFVGPSRGRILVDQLQSEQGTRYLHKRNRNVIVELPEGEEISVGRDFTWLTLAQIRELLAAGNCVNMNARTVLSCIRYDGGTAMSVSGDTFRQAVVESHIAGAGDDESELRRTLTWLADVKSELWLEVRRITLGELDHWISDGESIRHESGRFFRVIGVSVTAESREVGSWAQPMLQPATEGYVAFLCQRRRGVLQFLFQTRVEPGFIDKVELGATFHLSPEDYLRKEDHPPFAEYRSCPPEWVRLRAPQSEDGGRFYHDEKIHLVIELPENEQLDLPSNYRWMALGLLKRLMRCGYYVTIEARSLIACLG